MSHREASDYSQLCFFLLVNSSHRNAGGSKCQLSSFIKASAPPASASINLDNSTTHNTTFWRMDGGGSFLEAYSFHLDTVLYLS